jgi:hypothetical protein
MPIMNRVARFARSPQGRRLFTMALAYAQSPQGRAKIREVQRRLAERRTSRPPAR